MPHFRDSTGFTARAVKVALVLAAIAVLAGVFWLSYRTAMADLRQTQEVEMRSRIQTLESVLMRQRAVATVLADDNLAREVLRDPNAANRDRVSRKLDRLKTETDSAVIYLLDSKGVAISASNWDEGTSFVGEDYSFRDYFQQAMQNGEAAQFALGTVSRRAGLYLSHVIANGDGDGAGLGVVVVKVEFDRLQQAWQGLGTRTDVRDGTGLVILSSDPDLRLRPAPVAAQGEVVTAAPVPGTDWTLALTASARPARNAALLATGTAGFGLSLIGAAAAFALRARRRAVRRAEEESRYRADLEQAVDQRTRALQSEMRERRAVETRLERLRAEMVQANKLAALGQITAGIAHEVNQPLATIRLLAENGDALLQAGEKAELAANLSSIGRMTARITRITDQLRGFARKADGAIGLVALRDSLDVALLLTAAPREAQGIRLDLPEISDDLHVHAEKVSLEQILVNLLQNAQEALVAQSDPRITIAIDNGASVRVKVTDNGPGLQPEIFEQLFTPFVTSKPRGMGLGLVISQDLARTFGGVLSAAPPRPGQGACFILELPRAT